MVAMSVFGAALYASYVRSGLHLVHALTEREARLQSYFDLAPVGSAVLQPDGRILEVNDALGRVLGYARRRDARARLVRAPAASTGSGVVARAQTKIALARHRTNARAARRASSDATA